VPFGADERSLTGVRRYDWDCKVSGCITDFKSTNFYM
jgi:hypothetical protein